jgi:hypothetical protein
MREREREREREANVFSEEALTRSYLQPAFSAYLTSGMVALL